MSSLAPPILLLAVVSSLAATEPLESQQPEQSRSPFRFEDRAAAAGLNHQTLYGQPGANKYLLETTGSGVAWVDIDRDGDLDAFFVNGSRLEGFPQGARPVSRLYRNLGDGRFADITAAAGVGRHGWGQSVCAGDYDNDGFEDLFVTYWGQNSLWRNQGDGTFQDTARSVGLTQKSRRWNSGCSFLDYDRDGDLDLFVANYIDFDPSTAPTPDSGLCRYKGVPVACGPPGLEGGTNILYRNLGGSFEDVSEASGVAHANGTYALGVVTLDFNDDGWTDIYVANDSNPAALYENRRDGTFEDIGILAGVAYSQDGKPQAGMGVAVGDVDNDGRLDLFKTNFAEDTVNLYLNQGDGLFEDATFRSGLGVNTRWLGWGCGLFDFDNDGWLDVFEVNGHVYPEVAHLSDSTSYKQRKVVYRNRGGGRFQDVTLSAGADLSAPQAGRGAAFGDCDNDGDIDVLVNNVNSPPNLYLNQQRSGNGWLALRLLGRKSNRSGIGARVRLKVGDALLTDEVRSGGSYYSQNQLRLHFGLGTKKSADWIEIRWPSGSVDRHEKVAGQRLLFALEGGPLSPERSVLASAAAEK